MAKTKVDKCVGKCLNKKKQETAKIVSVEFLDGSDTKIVKGKAKAQFVNLPNEPGLVDGKIVKNKDRLSNKPRIKLKFDRPGLHPFKIKLLPAGSNATYKAEEKLRNSNFKFDDTEKLLYTDPDGNVILSGNLALAAAGCDIYGLTAKDNNGVTVNSIGRLNTYRLIYLVEIRMDVITNNIAKNLNLCIKEYSRNKKNIKLKKLGQTRMEYIKNISREGENSFLSKAKKAYNDFTKRRNVGYFKKKYSIAIAYTDQLAVKKSNQSLLKEDVQVGPLADPVIIPIVYGTESMSLWHDVASGEDWFVSCTFYSDELFGDSAITKDKCKIIENPGYKGSYNKVEISVDHLPIGHGSIFLSVNWVDYMRAGLSFVSGPLIVVCTKSWWRKKSTQEQNEVLIHELGHKIGMVPMAPDSASGSHHYKGLNSGRYLYNTSKGHVGEHCYFGCPDGQAKYNSDADAAKAKCVMYGQTKKNLSKFCPECDKSVRKLDISKGW